MLWMLCLATSSSPAPGPGVCWNVPRGGAVEYRRTMRAKATKPCRTRSGARQAPLEVAVPAKFLPLREPAPVLCEGELREDRRAVAGPICDLRDLLRAVAFDLSGRAVRAECARLLPYGDLRVSGSWSRRTADGAELLRARLRGRRVARRRDEAAGRHERLVAQCVEAVEGTVSVSRSVDAERGLVTGYHAECAVLVSDSARVWRRFELVDEWRLVAVRSNQDFDFRKRAAAGIRAGAEWIREAVAADRSFLADRSGARSFGSGRLALALLAMLHGGVPADDAVVDRGFRALCRRSVDDTYSLATALMATAARSRRGALRDDDRAAAARWLARLLRCVDPRGRPDELLGFGYERGSRTDTSLQQYGLLGLRAAQQLGLAVPAGSFAAAARQLLTAQAQAGAATRLELVGHDALLRVAPGEAPPVERSRARRRGFAYRDPGMPSYGAMTAAGVSGLLLARDGLMAQGRADRALLRALDDGVRDGFAWLAQHFSVRCNPGDAERADNHRGYYLYCLERCCELARVARLQGRDWYYEGSMQLLLAQQPSGAFRRGHDATLTLDSTCFAVLFLSKASKKGPITGG